MIKKKGIISQKPDVIFETFYNIQTNYASKRYTLLEHYFILVAHLLFIQYICAKICYELPLDQNGYTGYRKCAIIISIKSCQLRGTRISAINRRQKAEVLQATHRPGWPPKMSQQKCSKPRNSVQRLGICWCYLTWYCHVII